MEQTTEAQEMVEVTQVGSEKAELVPVEEAATSTMLKVRNFEEAKEMAKILAQAATIPEHYRKRPADILVAIDMANNMGVSVNSLMGGTQIISGKLGYKAEYLIGLINSCGKFTEAGLMYLFNGEGDDFSVTAYAYSKHTGEEVRGTPVSIRMAKQEGWYGKKGSKWQTMPHQMLCYRAASFFARLYVPEYTQGIMTVDELMDINRQPQAQERPAALAQLLGDGKPELHTPLKEGPKPDWVEPDVVDEARVKDEKKRIDAMKTAAKVKKWMEDNLGRVQKNTTPSTFSKIWNHADNRLADLLAAEQEN